MRVGKRQIFRRKKEKSGGFLPVIITKEAENPGKVGQDITLSSIPHQQKQNLMKAGGREPPNTTLEVNLVKSAPANLNPGLRQMSSPPDGGGVLRSTIRCFASAARSVPQGLRAQPPHHKGFHLRVRVRFWKRAELKLLIPEAALAVLSAKRGVRGRTFR